MVRLFDVNPPIWDEIIETLEKNLDQEKFKIEDFTVDWRQQAHRRKIDREVFEKYGYFKEIILNPKFQMLKSSYDEYAGEVDVNIFLGEPILPLSTSIILLFLIYGKVETNVLFFFSAFLFNINPLYVGLLVLLLCFSLKKRSVPKLYKNDTAIRKELNKAKSSIEEDAPISEEYDHILIGNSVSTLYCAAILAKNGHRCCVLQPSTLTPTSIFPPNAPCEAPVQQCVVNKLERYQFLLDTVQPLSPENRVVFAPIGHTMDDGFTHSILRLKQKLRKARSLSSKDAFFHVRTGDDSLAYDISSFLPINHSTLLGFFQHVKISMMLLSHFLYSRILSPVIDEGAAVKLNYENDEHSKSIREFVCGSIEKSLYEKRIENSPFLELISGLSTTLGSRESLSCTELSSVALGTLLNSADHGRHVPVGGITAVEKSLAITIQAAGGAIYDNIIVEGLEIEELNTSPKAFTALGVNIRNKESSKLIRAKHNVISGLGILQSYASLIPNECIHTKTKECLSMVKEMRPKVKIVFWVSGAVEELGISSVDYYETARANQPNYLESLVNKEYSERLASSYVHVWSPSAQDTNWKHRNIQVLVVEFEVVEPVVFTESSHWKSDHINLDTEISTNQGPQYYYSKREPETNPNHPDFSCSIGGRRLSLTASQRESYIREAELLIYSLYPKIRHQISFMDLVEPSLGGAQISNQTNKFAAELSVKTEISNLYLTGSDFAFQGFMGELQGGWLTANGVLGYNLQELVSGRNIFSDLYSM